MPSGVLNIRPSRLKPCARTLVVMLPFLYDAMPAFMYICGMVSFSRSFKVTRGIFGFLGVLETVVLSVVPLEDVLEVVGNAEEEALVDVGGEVEIVTN